MIEIDSFVPRQRIDQRFFDTPYYVAPNEPVAQEAFAVIRQREPIIRDHRAALPTVAQMNKIGKN